MAYRIILTILFLLFLTHQTSANILSPALKPITAEWNATVLLWDNRDEATPNGGRGQQCVACPEEGEYGYDASDLCLLTSWCVCRIHGDSCYSDYGWTYDIFLITLFIGNLYLGGTASIYCYQAYVDQKRRNINKPYSPMDKIVFLAASAGLLRVLWILTIVNGRRPETVMFGVQVDSILVKVPQIGWTCGYIYLACVWKRLVDQIRNMKKSTTDDQKALERKVNSFNLFLLLILIPITIMGALFAPIFTTIVNIVQLFISVGLVCCATSFGWSLSRSMSGVASAKPLVDCINRTVKSAIVCFLMSFFAIVLNIIFEGSDRWLMCFWVLVHFSELGTFYALLTTKRDQQSQRISPARLNTTMFGSKKSSAISGASVVQSSHVSLAAAAGDSSGE